MPSLLDSLANLHAQSEQIIHLSTHNYRSSGPFAQAYLGTPDVLSLIRDAEPSEARLFKFIGEEGSGNKKVEKRDGGVVTPLKEFKAKTGVESKDQVGVMLKTAMMLVEDYRPGPRARAHTQRLIDAHLAQNQKVAELERLIQEATEGISHAASGTASSEKTAQSERSVTEKIKAEEAALRQLEMLIAPHRPPPIPTDSSPLSPPSAQAPVPRSPSPPNAAPPPALYARTPAKTPQNMPHIANSLVNGMTPRRAAPQPLNRFSPLKLMGTPRAPVGGSRLREDGEGVARNIFSRASILRSSSSSFKRSTNTAEARSRSRSPEKDALEDLDTGETVRFGGIRDRAVSPEKAESTSLFSPEKPDAPVDNTDEPVDAHDETPRQSPIKSTEALPIEPTTSKVEGVDVDLEWVQKATSTVHSTLSEMMRQGLRDDTQTQAENTPRGVIRHLYMISQSDPAPPPSPSNSSSISSLGATATAPPITTDTILLGHLLLMLFRSDEGDITVQTAKENLGSIARARGWVEGDDKVSKVIYTAVGKRAIKIDRRIAGGKIVFV